jgi:hypothetical protein
MLEKNKWSIKNRQCTDTDKNGHKTKENIQHDTTQNTKKMSVCEQRYSRKWAITVSYKIK